MKYIPYFFILLSVVTACNPVKRITGTQPNGSNYVLTIDPNGVKIGRTRGDSAVINGNIHIAGLTDQEAVKIATKGMVILNHDSSYTRVVLPDSLGHFSRLLTPGKYYCIFGAVGYGKLRTKEFKVNGADYINVQVQLYPDTIIIDDIAPAPYKTVPKRQ